MNEDLDYSVSARRKYYRQGIEWFLKCNYQKELPYVKSVFGFAEFCRLYGGRPWDMGERANGRELSDDDIKWMYDRNIGLRLPVQNLFGTYEDYKQEKDFFRKYHREGNILIIAKDNLATWIRNDFPKYRIEASFIKRINTIEKAEATYPLYDTYVPDVMVFAKNYDLLDKLDRKRCRLFTNASCGFTCKRRTCYLGISKKYLALPHTEAEGCCEEGIKKPVFFDVEKYKEMGFTKFKYMHVGAIYNTI